MFSITLLPFSTYKTTEWLQCMWRNPTGSWKIGSCNVPWIYKMKIEWWRDWLMAKHCFKKVSEDTQHRKNCQCAILHSKLTHLYDICSPLCHSKLYTGPLNIWWMRQKIYYTIILAGAELNAYLKKLFLVICISISELFSQHTYSKARIDHSLLFF